MPLQLVLGPSGARKVGRLLDAHEAASRAGRTAWFVVPNAADVEPFQRELAGIDGPPGEARRTGVPFGAVMTETRMQRRLLERFGAGETMLAPDHRRAVALAAVHATDLTALEPAARSGWLADEIIGLADELAATGDLGRGAEAGLEAWSARGSDSRGDELAALLRADAAILGRLAVGTRARHVDRARAATIVRAALGRDPQAAADLHVVLQGFDDLDPVQRALVVALGRSAAHVIVSLPYAEGREALVAASPLVEALRAEARGRVEELTAAPAGAAPSPLEQLAGRLYETGVHLAPPAAPEPDPFAPLAADAQELGPLVAYDDPTPAGDAGESVAPAADPAWAGADQAPTLDGARLGPSEHAGAASTPGASTDTSAAGAEPDTHRAPVVELCGGGPDEEAALIAEHVAACLAAGCPPARIAVVVPVPAVNGPAVEAALRRAGVPAHLVARRPARVWPSVGAIVALLRAVGEGGEARHLVDWIAGPGGPGGADTFDAAARRRGATGFWDGLKVWASLGHARMQEVDDLRDAARRRERDRLAADPVGPLAEDDDGSAPATGAVAAADEALEAVVARILRTRLAAAMTRMGSPSPEEERDLRAVAQILSLLDGLVTLGRDAPDLGLGLRELATLIEGAPSPPEREPAGSVAIVDPLDVRTRYPEVVVIARAGRNVYPSPEPIRRVLTRGDRARLSVDHGWPVPARPEHVARQRLLAYEVVARPSRQLVLAWHRGNGDGKPVEPSPLLAEVRRVAADEIPILDLPSGAAPRHAARADRLARLHAARDGARHREPSPAHAPLLAAQDRDRYAVGELQTASRCAAQWFVNHHLRPEPLSPDAAPLTAGRLRHELLAEIVRTTVTDGAPLAPEAVPHLCAALTAAAARLAAKAGDETQAERLMRDRVVAEVEATIPGLCGDRQLAHQPIEFELPFGTAARRDEAGDGDEIGPEDDDEGRDDDARPPVTVERAGQRLTLAGRIDRLDLDTSTGELVVVDYKGANVDPFKGAGWVEGRELQAGLYALAAEQLAGPSSHAVASLYQPVPGPANQPPRGATATDLPGRPGLLRNDQVGQEAWDDLLDALVQLAAGAQRGIDDGVVAPEPQRCSAGGCRYPWLCREVQG